MNIKIEPLLQPVEARMNLPGSKSISNRALILAALCDKPSTLTNVLQSDDTFACKDALQEIALKHDVMHIHCRDSGIVTRFLLPVCAALGGSYHFDASTRMRERPIGPLLDILKAQGVDFEFLHNPGKMPFILKSQGLPGGGVHVNVKDSSQFLSGLLIAAPLCRQGMVLRPNAPIASKPYVQMTLALMEKFGVRHEVIDEFTLRVTPQRYQNTELAIEPDASTASYFFAAAALSQSAVQIADLGIDSLQGDLRFLNVLEKMGCRVERSESSITLRGPTILQGVGEISMSGFSDTFMTLAVMAPFLPVPTLISGLRHTRLQESDRVAAMAENLKRVGIHTKSTEDTLMIFPGTPCGATIDSHNDHRIAMSFGVMGLVVPDIIIEGAECVRKTCPEFFELLAAFAAAKGALHGK